MRLQSQLIGLVTIFLWLFVEAALLSSSGFTAGKWLLCVSVRAEAGQRLSYGAALKPAFELWYRGEGFAIPLVSLVTRRKAYETLTQTRKTSWDAASGFHDTYNSVSRLRLAIAIGLLVAFSALRIWLATAS